MDAVMNMKAFFNDYFAYLRKMNPISKKIIRCGCLLLGCLYFAAFIVAALSGRMIEYGFGMELFTILTENARGCLPIIFLGAFLLEPLYKKCEKQEEE